jgi:ABC-type multidrug transport system ATPase subunit
MGPSGAGKTTFLSTLSGKVSIGTILGSVEINGKKDDIANYKKVMGFVPQEVKFYCPPKNWTIISIFSCALTFVDQKVNESQIVFKY